MSVILLLIPFSVLIAGGFLFAFIWAVRAGQYDDLATPALRILPEDAASPARPVPDLQPSSPEGFDTAKKQKSSASPVEPVGRPE